MNGRWLLLALAALLGYGAYRMWPEPPPPPAPSPRPSLSPAPTPVPFPVKVKVKRMIEEWQRLDIARQNGQADASRVSFASDLADIVRHLQGEGRHGEDDLRRLMQAAAREAGYAEDESAALVDAVISEAGSSRR